MTGIVGIAALGLVAAIGEPADAGAGMSPEARAVAYLAQEVPRWSRENGCYSCHNNADAARALVAASAAGDAVPAGALADTLRWLSRPEDWDDNGGDGAFSDKRLARIQFAHALAAAVQAGAIADRAPLRRAADRLAEDQAGDGTWAPDGPDAIGSPATYGRPLATLAARDVLAAADPERFRDRLAAADSWLDAHRIETVLDASVELLRAGAADHPAAAGRRRTALDLLRRGQTADGGWGPFLNAPPEPFDTALALLALARCGDAAEVAAMRRRGRSFLVAAQLPEGGWIETTRPTGGQSYAQHISTTAWATLALMATRSDSQPAP